MGKSFDGENVDYSYKNIIPLENSSQDSTDKNKYRRPVETSNNTDYLEIFSPDGVTLPTQTLD